MCWWAWMGWRGECLACLHLSAELMGRERWGRPPPMLSTQLTDKCKWARPLASPSQTGEPLPDWGVGRASACRLKGLHRLEWKAGLVCVCVCVKLFFFFNMKTWPYRHIMGCPLSHNVCLIVTGAMATFVQRILLQMGLSHKYVFRFEEGRRIIFVKFELQIDDINLDILYIWIYIFTYITKNSKLVPYLLAGKECDS